MQCRQGPKRCFPDDPSFSLQPSSCTEGDLLSGWLQVDFSPQPDCKLLRAGLLPVKIRIKGDERSALDRVGTQL